MGLFISKKELLKETGISYGQLYRWKREGLIPEEWFMKQPSHTGQETFFQRSQILKRIHVIKKMKEQYSLDELAVILSPEVSEKLFRIEDIAIIEEISPELLPIFKRGFQKESFTYIEVLIMMAISEFDKHTIITQRQMMEILGGLRVYQSQLKATGYTISFIENAREYFVIIQEENTQTILDQRLKLLKKISLNELSNLLKQKYSKYFNIMLDQEDMKLQLNKKEEQVLPTNNNHRGLEVELL